jgi:hypothetical protein
MRSSLIFLILLSLNFAVFAGPAGAQPKQLYKLELVVFSHVSPASLNIEKWPATPDLPSLANALELGALPLPAPANTADIAGVIPSKATLQAVPSSVPSAPTVYQVLPYSNFDLNKAVAKLSRNSAYQVLVHVAWLQPGVKAKQAKKLHIYGGNAYDNDGSVLTNVSPLLVTQPMPPANTSANTPTGGMPAAADVSATQQALPAVSAWQVDGFVKISQPYLFQLNADLVLTIPQAQLNDMASDLVDDIKTNQFVLHQTFRLKLGELYYIDHPLFGVLAQVTKYTPSTSNKT